MYYTRIVTVAITGELQCTYTRDIKALTGGKQGCTHDIIMKASCECCVVSTGPCMLVVHVLLASGVTYTHTITVFFGQNKYRLPGCPILCIISVATSKSTLCTNMQVQGPVKQRPAHDCFWKSLTVWRYKYWWLNLGMLDAHRLVLTTHLAHFPRPSFLFVV